MTNIRLFAPFLCTLASAALWAAPGDITIRGAEVWRSSDGPRVVHGSLTVAPAASLTLEAGSSLEVSGSIRVARGAALTIQPGVVVKFAAGADNGISVEGSIDVRGTAARPVYFTSALDAGSGITRYPTSLPGMAKAATAKAGDWEGIRIDSAEGTSSTIENAIVRYSRAGLTTSGGGTVATSNNVFRDNATGNSAVTARHGEIPAKGTQSLQPRMTQPNLMPQFSTVPSGWTVSRYAPAGFAPPSPTQFGRPSELQITINQAQGYSNRPPANQSQYFGFQGYSHSLSGAGVGDYISADIYVPSALGNSSAGNAASYMWAIGSNTNGEADYAIIGFTNSVGHGEFTVWDDSNEAFVDLSTPVIYNSFNTLTVIFTGSTFDYYVNGSKVYSMNNNNATTFMSTTIMDSVNFFDPTTAFTGLNYSVIWANSAAASTTALTSSLNPSTLGVPVTLTATVSPSSATGFATFVDGTTILGTGTLSSGVATFQTSSLAVGTHPLTAVYGGDGNDSGSSSAQLTQSVGKAITTTSLSSSVNAPSAGQAINLTATVSPSSATGTVTFYDNSSALGTATLVSGTAQFSASFGYGSQSLTATYNGDANDATSSSSAVSLSIPYPPLTITTSSLPSGAANQAYGPVTFAATGGSGAFNWSGSGFPAGLNVSGSGTLNGTSATGFSGSVTVTVTDSITHLSTSQTYQLLIAAPPLSISGPATLGDVLVGGSVSATYTPTGGLAPYTYSVSGAPGLGIDTSGHVTGSAGSAGTFTVTVSVRDSLGNAASTTATLAVLAVSTSALPGASTTTSYSASISVIGGIPPYTYSASGTPPGISFASGSFSGKATTAGTYPVNVTVTDSTGLSITTSYSITVTGSPTLTVTSTALPGGVVGQPYSAVLTASGGVPAYTWAQSGGVIPPGLTVNASGTVSGTPTAPTPTPYSVGVQATDTTGAVAVGSVSIGIAPAPIQITTGSLPAAVANVPYPAQILSASGGVAPYTFSIQGSLPAGLSLSNGQIGGTPTSPGISSFTIKASDSAPTPSSATLAASISVGPSSTTLVLGSGSVSFSIAPGNSGAPPPAAVAVTSSNIAVLLNFSYTSSVPWLTLSGSTTTPGTISIALNSAALALTSSGSPYSGTVTVNCTSAACAANSTQTIGVTLTVSAPPPQLSVDTKLISFVAMATSPQSSSSSFSISNVGGGSITVNSVSAADPFITVGSFPATLASGPATPVSVTANPAGLSAGYYRSSVNVTTTAGSASIPVTLLISGASSMTLGPAGTQFTVQQGGVLGNPSSSFLVSVTSTTAVSYTAAVQTGANFLSVTSGSGSSSASSPGTVRYSLNQSGISTLGAGAYYGSIRVTASGVVNSPQDFQVVLIVSPPTTPVVPDAEPAGLVFITSGSVTPPAQLIQVYADSALPVQFQASSNAVGAANFLSNTPSVGSASSASPGQIQVTASPAGLSPGIYRGGVSVSFASSSVRTVNITLIVTAPLPSISGATGTKPQDAKATCTGGQLAPTQTGLVSNFSSPASWPTPLAIVLADTCGNLIGTGQIVTTFSNGDPPLPLTLVNAAQGLYSGTWTPRTPGSQVVVQARASAPGYSNATAQISGQVAPNVAPVLAPNATGDVFDPQVGGGLGPGNIVQIYGTGLAAQTVTPAVLPLPTAVSGTSVVIGGVQAPLFYVSPGQINAQIPVTLTPNQQYQVIVNANGALTTPQPIQLNAGVPSVLEFSSGAVVAQHPDSSLVTTAAPAAPGENLVIYLTGLGATTVNVPSGSPAPSNPLAYVVNTPTLTLNNASVPLLFAGLTPGLVGLYQINFQVPTTLANGNYNLAISQNGTVSNSTILPVHQ